MGKTKLTEQIDLALHKEFNKQGVFFCSEVTIGWFGSERVDGLCYNTKCEWRCFEVKVSKLDFHSKAKKTFLGHFNYYAMPVELYKEVKDEISKEVGVYLYYPNEDENKQGSIRLEKKPKRQELGIDEKILYESMIRSLCRDACKYIDNKDDNKLENCKKELNRYKLEKQSYYQQFIQTNHQIQELLGHNWSRHIEQSDIGNGYPEWHFINGWRLIKEGEINK